MVVAAAPSLTPSDFMSMNTNICISYEFLSHFCSEAERLKVPLCPFVSPGYIRCCCLAIVHKWQMNTGTCLWAKHAELIGNNKLPSPAKSDVCHKQRDKCNPAIMVNYISKLCKS